MSVCPIHKKQLLPVPRRLGASAEEAQPGATRPGWEHVALANDDDLEPALVIPAAAPSAAADGPGRPHTDLEACLERIFTQGRELAGTIIRLEVDTLEMGIVAGHRSAQKAHPDDGSRLAQQARYRAARIGRARRVQRGDHRNTRPLRR